MRILAFDTTAVLGSIALLDGDVLLEEMELEAPQGFSSVLFAATQELLARHGMSVQDVDAFASASGPGTFTGVRVGLTAAKALAEATGKPAIGVSNLQAMAAFGSSDIRAAASDARRGDVYGGLFDANLRELADEIVAPMADWIASLPPGLTEVVTPDAALLAERFPYAVRIIEQRTLAAAVARIGRDRLMSGASGDPAGLDANYVRRADAEMKWKDEPVARTAGS